MRVKDNTVEFNGEYVTLGQLLKVLDLVNTGGEQKLFLSTHDITVNGEKEERRGRKLRDKDKVLIDGKAYELCMLKE